MLFSVYIAVRDQEGVENSRARKSLSRVAQPPHGRNSNVKNLTSLKNVCVMMLMDVNQNKKICRIMIGCIWARSLIARRLNKCFVGQLLTDVIR